jgi:hypothetical protein
MKWGSKKADSDTKAREINSMALPAQRIAPSSLQYLSFEEAQTVQGMRSDNFS